MRHRYHLLETILFVNRPLKYHKNVRYPSEDNSPVSAILGRNSPVSWTLTMKCSTQCCGTGFIEPWSWSGSSISSESGSGSRALMTKNWEKYSWKIYIFFKIKNCNLLIPRSPGRTSKLQEKPSVLKTERPAIQSSGSTTLVPSVSIVPAAYFAPVY